MDHNRKLSVHIGSWEFSLKDEQFLFHCTDV